MNAKKVYLWQLASFLNYHKMQMSGDELALHLNRNKFLTSLGSEYGKGRGIYKLIRETWIWLNDDLNLPNEASKIAAAFVKNDGSYAYE
jgi:hypothetical protein